jgi:hypothetical protein
MCWFSLVCEKMSAPLLGIVENMSGYVCTCCERRCDVFGVDADKYVIVVVVVVVVVCERDLNVVHL